MKILLLSAYHAQSHQSWCQSLSKMFPEYEWVQLSLPARYFNWRIRGNALSWSLSQRSILKQHYDMVVATSMVDCATLRGLVPTLANLPWLVYFHENQFAYPVDTKNDRIEPKMVSLYNALCAQAIYFNSEFNYQSFIDGLSAFLKKMPDEVPSSTLSVIKDKSFVLAVPIDVAKKNMVKKSFNKVPVLLWNHRWEYDKGPKLLLNLLNELARRNFEFKLNLLGQQFRKVPIELDEIKKTFKKNILNIGFIESTEQYELIVKQSDFVLSTALHDFQGLAVLESVSLGCIPVVPNRLAYKEIFPKKYCYDSLPDKPIDEAVSMADKIEKLWKEQDSIDLDDINIEKFSLQAMKHDYSSKWFL